MEETFTTNEETQTTRDENDYGTPVTSADDTISFDDSRQRHTGQGNDPPGSSVLESLSMMDDQSTPAMPASVRIAELSAAALADNNPSPVKALRGERRSKGNTQQSKPNQPITPGKQTVANSKSTAESSPLAANSTRQVAPLFTAQGQAASQDPLLHRVLDKSYRIMATPHTQRKQKAPTAAPAAANTPGNRPRWRDTIGSSPASSPELTAPQLRSDIFFSPMRAPRTPGITIVSGRAKNNPRPGEADGEKARLGINASSRSVGAWGSDSDGDDIQGLSPPKTMHFHIPQSRLLQTPGKSLNFIFQVCTDVLFSERS